MISLIYIAIGGAIGAILRYWVSGVAYNFFGTLFPYGTLSVNVIGSFFIGMLFELLEDTAIPPNIRLMIFIGIFGAFTTFSSFSLETVNLLRDGEMWLGTWNIILNNVLSISGTIIGILLAKYIIRG